MIQSPRSVSFIARIRGGSREQHRIAWSIGMLFIPLMSLVLFFFRSKLGKAVASILSEFEANLRKNFNLDINNLPTSANGTCAFVRFLCLLIAP